jgi:serine/threonine protein kinase
MALKVALSFEQISREMQENFREASVFAANVQQRMREEYEVMTACAASPHILDAFCMGNVWLGGSWRPCILMELSGLGDAERVYIQPASAIGGSAPRGIGSVMAQRIVRQAAVALKDLHSMSGHMHLDLKVNNLLVFGSKESPCIKLCDFGCAKKRSDEPRYGPASGTKDWQAPEQMAGDALDGPVAGRLDYCTDSWALGLLVLGLRKGQQPFWWLKQEGRLPSEMPDALRSSLSSNDSPYLSDSPRGSKLTRLEVSFVTTCLASHSSRRPPVKDLLEDAPYLSSRYRGG